MAMNPEIKEQWVKALRSGDYEQGKRHLNKEGKYCCLGVLCELAEKAGVVESHVNYLTTYYGTPEEREAGKSASSIPPYSVVDWAGLSSPDPTAGSADGTTLSELNDHGMTFGEIATRIENHL